MTQINKKDMLKTYSVNKCEPSFASNNWQQAHCLEDFSYPWETDKRTNTSFRALYDDVYFYFHFEVAQAKPISYVKDNNKMEVVKSERVELFFAVDPALATYYCLEMDAMARVLDYKASYYREFDFKWQWPKGEIEVVANQSNSNYVVEGKISLQSLRNLAILKSNEMMVGVYRGECTQLEDTEATLRWISWVDPKTEKPDFHVPASFGRFVLADSSDI